MRPSETVALSRLGGFSPRDTPFSCGLTASCRSIRLEQTKNMKAARPGRLGRMNTHLQRFSDDRAASSAAPGPAKSTGAPRPARHPFLWHRRPGFGAWRRADARGAARNCSGRRTPPRRGNRICAGTGGTRCHPFRSKKKLVLGRRRHGARRKRRAARRRTRYLRPCTRAAGDGEGRTSSRSVLGDGRSAALPRRGYRDWRNARRRDRWSGHSTALTRCGRKRRAGAAAALSATNRQLDCRHPLDRRRRTFFCHSGTRAKTPLCRATRAQPPRPGRIMDSRME